MTKQTFKRYAISSAITFLTGFLMVIGLEIDTITIESFKDGTAGGLFFVAFRAGVKMMIEFLLPLLKDFINKFQK